MRQTRLFLGLLIVIGFMNLFYFYFSRIESTGNTSANSSLTNQNDVRTLTYYYSLESLEIPGQVVNSFSRCTPVERCGIVQNKISVTKCTWYIYHHECTLNDGLRNWLEKNRIDYIVLANQRNPNENIPNNCIVIDGADHAYTCLKLAKIFNVDKCDKCVVKADSDVDYRSLHQLYLNDTMLLGTFDGTYKFFGQLVDNPFGVFVGFGAELCRYIRSYHKVHENCLFPFVHDDKLIGLFCQSRFQRYDLNGRNLICEYNKKRFFLNYKDRKHSCPGDTSECLN